METLYGIGLTNALMVAAIAPLAFVLGRLFRKRPAWTHAVWVVVLLKLVTPPVVGVPIGWSRADFPRTPPQIAAPVTVETMPLGPIEADLPVVLVEGIEPPPGVETWTLPSWPTTLGLIWLGGSTTWAMLATWRIVRFARAMRRADDAPDEIAAWVADLAERIGLARPPRVVIAPGRISPMVWALGGRACLVVPQALWDRLDDAQRSAMLVHELAHLRRRDHWVRILELVAIGLFWWHPVLWLARRELHRAEELCCDSWVVWTLPQSKKNYAAALVEAVEFLSESRPNKLPVGASGMGQVEDLSRRIGMILRGDAPRGLGRFGSIAVIGLGLLLLPWRPTLATQQGPEPKPEEAKRVEEVKPEKAVPKDLDEQIRELLDEWKNASKGGKPVELERAEYDRFYERLKWSSEMLKRKYVSPATVKADMASLLRAKQQFANAKTSTKAIGAQDDLDDATAKLSEAYLTAKAQYDLARADEERTMEMNKQGIVSQTVVNAAKSQTLTAKAKLGEVARREKNDAADRELALIDAQDAIATATGKLKIQQAKVAKADAQRKLAIATMSRLKKLSDRNASMVSNDEMEKAKAELEVADALVQEAKAEQDQAAIEVGQAQRRHEILKGQQTPATKTTATAPDGPPVVDGRIDELEKKLDRVLKEIEAMRKEQGAAKPATTLRGGGGMGGGMGGGGMGGGGMGGGGMGGMRGDGRGFQGTLMAAAADPDLSNEDLVRKIYRVLFDRDPTQGEIGKIKFTEAAERPQNVQVLLRRLVPVYLVSPEDMVDTLLGDDDMTYSQAVERLYRSILNRPPTKAEREARKEPADFAKNRREELKKLIESFAEKEAK